MHLADAIQQPAYTDATGTCLKGVTSLCVPAFRIAAICRADGHTSVDASTEQLSTSDCNVMACVTADYNSGLNLIYP